MAISSPTLLLDEARCRLNIQAMTKKAAATGISLRPHFKTHQSLRIGSWFRDYGVEKICVSSVSMALYFAEDGWEDILIAFPYNPGELTDIRELARKTKLTLCITGPESAEMLTGSCDFDVSVLIKVDTGYGRSGTIWDDSDSLQDTYRILNKCKHISVKGLMTHSGNTYKAKSKEEIKDISELSINRMKSARESIRDNTLILSVGDTPSASICNSFPGIDELRPGNFIFYDLMQYFIGSCRLEQVAVVVACPIVDISKNKKQAIIYGGGVHFSKEYTESKGKRIYGMLVEQEGQRWKIPAERIYLESLSQEHGIIRSEGGLAENLSIGDLVYIIPVHSCLSAEALGQYILTDGTKADHMQIKYRNKI